MQNQNFLQSFVESNAQANNITHIHWSENRDIINQLVGALKSIDHTTHINNLTINNLNYTR